MNYRSILLATLQTTALFVAGFVIPLLGQLVAVFAPVPLIILAIREGRQAALVALLASTLFTGVLFGWQSGVHILFQFRFDGHGHLRRVFGGNGSPRLHPSWADCCPCSPSAW